MSDQEAAWAGSRPDGRSGLVASPPATGVTPLPRRLQRTRSNRRLPRNAAYVGPRSEWASPFRSRMFGHVAAVQLHRSWLTGRFGPAELRLFGYNDHEIAALIRLRQRQRAQLRRLRGRDLVCWCPRTSRWRHADTLMFLANRTAQP